MELDERFSKLAKDPSYKKITKKDKKIKIDSRFEKMFTDERFQTKFTTDKRGKVIDVEEKEDLHSFYDIDHDEDSEQNKAIGDIDDEHADETEERVDKIAEKDQLTNIMKKKKKKGKLLVSAAGKNLQSRKRSSLGEKKKKTKSPKEEEIEIEETEDEPVNIITPSGGFVDIRGETLPDSSDSDVDNDVENDDLDIDGDNIIHGWGEIDDDVKYIENAETQRIAVCNCDWDRIGATDIYMLFNSFKPVDGSIISVKIYPSDFGINRMKEEKASGPKELVESASQGDEDHVEGSQYHMEKLREYQLNRLKYYYAVAECDSIGTANKIYEELDGKEYEMSATRLDLRFIPNDTTFDHAPKSVADGSSQLKNYEPVNYLNTALQQTTVRLTWDEVDNKRMQATMKQFTQNDIENMDFKDFLASSSSDEDEESVAISTTPTENEVKDDNEVPENENKKIDVYKKLMQEIEAKEENNNKENIDILFDNGGGEGDKVSKFNDFSLKNSARQEYDDSSENESGEEKDDGDYDDEEDNDEDDIGDQTKIENDEGFNDPFFTDISQSDKNSKDNSKKKKKRMRQTEDSEDELDEFQAKSKKELELLLLDETEDKRHFNLKNIIEQEKSGKSKKKKRKEKDIKEEVDNFKVNVTDPRFSALYSSHLYAIDPSEPNFKHTKATEAIIEESHRQRKENKSVIPKSAENKIDSNLSGLLKSVKSKTELHRFKKEKAQPKR